MENITIMPATNNELAPIKELLKQASLPFEDIDKHISNFLIARMDENIIGAVGLEIYDDNALLRSIVVVQEMR
ncbi:MAG: N-acetylglutamate synthase, partial [Fimbriimonadaceae bacterium]|nr:N-acetylglutamate synthase [Chitinophagales bacterium]